MEFIYSVSGSRWCVLNTLIGIWRLIGRFILKCLFVLQLPKANLFSAFSFFSSGNVMVYHRDPKTNFIHHLNFPELWSNWWKYHFNNLWCVLYSVTTILILDADLANIWCYATQNLRHNATKWKIPFEIDQCRCMHNN